MSEQRYYLLRKEENDINKGSSGLELEILDEWTGKRRNVRSLSGGESFKAALSLALGLSDVIQNKKGGIQVDTIFIDEGFGTLDADSLNKAMQIINSLSLEGNKLVGIISHVDELKDQIDQKIEVYKDHAGSKVKQKSGQKSVHMQERFHDKIRHTRKVNHKFNANDGETWNNRST